MRFSNLINNGPSNIQLCAITQSPFKAIVLLIFLVCFWLTPGYGQAVIHVDKSAAGANDGTSWADAYSSLNSALANATGSDVIVIAAGTYKPGSGRSDSFTITGAQDGLKIYGGWAGTESFSDLSDVETQLDSRDLEANQTILSGDIDNNDLPFAPQSPSDDDSQTPTVTDHIQGGNSYTIWVLDGRSAGKGGQGPITRSTVIDGMTITGSLSDDNNLVQVAGGGMRCNASGAGCSPTISNMIFKGNIALEGGAIGFQFDDSGGESSPRIEHSIFYGNVSKDYDGGALAFGGFWARSGGKADIDIIGSVFVDNVAFNQGGAIYLPQFDNSSADVDLDITGTTFAENKNNFHRLDEINEQLGRAIYNSGGELTLTNCIIKSAPPVSDGFADYTALHSSISGYTLSHTLVEHGPADIDAEFANYLDENGNPVSFEQSTNMSGAPKFLRSAMPAGGDGLLGTADDGLHLREDSPALNVGLNNSVDVAIDLTGAPRIQNGTVDLGAYEGAIPPSVIFVDASAPDGGDGSSWGTAFNDPQEAVAATGPGDEIWVAEGVYRPDTGDSTSPWLRIDGNQDGLQIYGGFTGNESRRSQRRPRQHPTIFSGDIGGDDTDPDSDGIIEHYTDKNGSNAKQIFGLEANQSAGSITRLTVIDGLTITAGGRSGINISDSPTPTLRGGGLFCEVLDADVSCGPVLNNLIFVGNAAVQGSALSFYYNAEQHGGGQPSFTNSIFTGNGTDEGTLEIRSELSGNAVVVELSNNVFTGNYASTSAAGLHILGGLYDDVDSVRVVVTNTSFIGNTSDGDGGAINALVNSSSSVELDLTNSIFWDNQADADGDGNGSGNHIFTESDDLTLSYSIMEGGASGVVGTTVSDFANSTNIDADPQFFARDLPAGDDQMLGTADDGFRLLSGSPALNAGTNDLVSLTTDLAGGDRIQDGTVDLGAYEGAYLGSNRLTITGSEGWRMMTAPADNISYAELLDPLWTQGFPGADRNNSGDTPNVLVWDESAQQFQPVTDATTIPDAGQGFIVYVYDDQDYDGSAEGFPKVLPVDQSRTGGTVTSTLSYNDNGTSNDGFNLVGNPYGITIDWDDPDFTKTNLNAPFYVWSDSANSGTGAYLSWNGSVGTLPDGKIAPWQGFWVQANGASPTLQFTDGVRDTGGTFYKETDQAKAPQVTFELTGTQLKSKAVVMFNDQAQAGRDRLDALKLESLNEQYLSLYTTDAKRHALDINALPRELEKPLQVALNFKGSNVGGKYTLSWDPQGLPDSWDKGSVTLTDQHTDRVLNLNKAGEYSFKVEEEKQKTPGESGSSAETRLIASPQHGPIPTILKAKAPNPRFVLTVSPNENGQITDELPKKLQLNQNYPNPFNPTTNIRYALPEAGNVELEVYDVLGRRVQSLVNEEKAAGRYNVTLDGSNLASGVYFYRLQTPMGTKIHKMTLIK